MNIYIAGGAGFLGTNIVKRWLKKFPKYNLVVLDNFSYGPNQQLQTLTGVGRLNVIEIDARNNKELKTYFEQQPPDILINAIDGTRDPEFLEITLLSTVNLLELSKAFNVKHFIHLSCNEVYGSAEPTKEAQRLLVEGDILLPSSPQQAAKASADLLVWSYYSQFNLPITILRSAYLFGPYQNSTRLIPLMITHAIQNQSFPLYGGENVMRDVLHVDDLIDALELLIDVHQAHGQIFNVGAGVQMRLVEIAETILTLLERSKNLISVEDSGELVHRTGSLDATKLINTFSWSPKKTPDIHASLEETVQWYKANKQWWAQ
jgi:dTDP-glucose 4,6-dehydratase